MAVQYRLDIKSTAGVMQAQVTDFAGTLSYKKRVNEVGLLTFALQADHAAIAYLTPHAQVECWRRDTTNGVAWTRDFEGLVLTTRYRYPANGPEVFELWCPSTLTMLTWRTVAWHAETANRSKFTAQKAETICSNLVNYNACANATVVNGRLRAGAITGMTAEADGAAGNTIDFACAYANLLSSLQEVARIGGGDFALVGTGAGTWQWRWYEGQLGTDRSASLTFALERGNMANPSLTDSRADEATVAIVGGQGEASARTTAVRTGADYVLTTRDKEVFRDARDRTTAAGLNAAGDEYLDQKRARPELTFDLISTPACVYGLHWFLGDKAVAKYRTYNETVKVAGVAVSVNQDGAETIQAELEEV